jgi:Tfp pilus assembly protein PilO
MAKPGASLKAGSNQIFAVIAMVMVFLGLGYYLVLYRAISEDISNAEAQMGTLMQQEQTWSTKQRTYRTDVEELNRRRARSREQVKILPSDADMDAFLDNLNSIAELSGLTIQSTEPQPEQPQEGFYARLPVQLAMRGRYFQLAKFLFNIGRVDRIINMQNIVLSNPTVVDNEVVLEARVLATTFRSLSETAEPAAGAPATGAPAPGAVAPDEAAAPGG